MENYKTEVILTGEFTTIDVFLEGTEVPLSETESNTYYKEYPAFAIEGLLDLNVRLKGWTGMSWSLKIKIRDKEVYSRSGVFDIKGFVTFTASIQV